MRSRDIGPAVHPILIDRRPSYLAADGGRSVLQLPSAHGTLLRALTAALLPYTGARPAVLATFAVTPAYRRAVREANARALILETPAAVREYVATLDQSEEVLLVDAAIQPTAGYASADLAALLGAHGGVVRHLVTLDDAREQTQEYVHADPAGQVRRIQRYYHPVTWPFSTGVACSVVPIAALLGILDPPFDRLPELRRAIATSGVPSHDVPHVGRTLDLSAEGGALALVEQLVHDEEVRQSRRPRVLREHNVAPTARLVGPVVVADSAEVGEGAVIVGPAMICGGARVGAGATVAQCLVLPDASVPPGAVCRHRVVGDDPTALEPHARGIMARGAPLAEPWAETAPVPHRGKVVVEAGAALVALLVLAPLLAVVAALVKLTSRGPALFGHAREGLDGRVFRCWKFRTMHAGADAVQRELFAQQQLDGPQFKMTHDPRVTPLGRWLRATNIDELPQLINVLLGQMSFVGPRPSPFRENQICVPWRRARLSVRPGITGLWQVCRHDREHGDFHQWIEYDLLYVRHMSPLLDLRILVATALTLGGRRAVPVARLIPALAEPPVESSSTLGRNSDEYRTSWSGEMLGQVTPLVLAAVLAAPLLRGHGRAPNSPRLPAVAASRFAPRPCQPPSFGRAGESR